MYCGYYHTSFIFFDYIRYHHQLNRNRHTECQPIYGLLNREATHDVIFMNNKLKFDLCGRRRRQHIKSHKHNCEKASWACEMWVCTTVFTWSFSYSAFDIRWAVLLTPMKIISTQATAVRTVGKHARKSIERFMHICKYVPRCRQTIHFCSVVCFGVHCARDVLEIRMQKPNGNSSSKTIIIIMTRNTHHPHTYDCRANHFIINIYSIVHTETHTLCCQIRAQNLYSRCCQQVACIFENAKCFSESHHGLSFRSQFVVFGYSPPSFLPKWKLFINTQTNKCDSITRKLNSILCIISIVRVAPCCTTKNLSYRWFDGVMNIIAAVVVVITVVVAISSSSKHTATENRQ